MRILIFCAEYLPGDRGGAVRAMAGLVHRLAGDHEFYVFARDRSEGAPAPYDGIVHGRWQRRGDATVFYASRRDLAPHRMAAIIRSADADVYYPNSFVSPGFGSMPVMLRWLGMIPNRPMVIAPRGEFHPAVLRLRGFVKKSTFVRIARSLPAHERVLWHAGSPEECDHIRRQFRRAQVAVARDLTALSAVPEYPRSAKRSGELSVAFLARIAPSKNLLAALRMVRELKGDVRLDVYGPVVDAKYLRRCLRAARELPANIRVCFEGEIPHDRVVEALSSHHVFLLPTVGESFCHAILEALLAGCMLVISDQTPWRRLRSRGVGWDLPLADEQAFVRALQSCIDMGDPEFATGSAAARELGAAAAESPAAIQENRALFERARLL